MANLYAEAITLNNQGVAMIEAGSYANARATFKKALSHMKSNVKGESRKRQLNDGESAVYFRWSSDTPPLPAERSQLESSVGSTFVYRRSLLILAAQFHGNHDCYPETAAMLYNLSLSFHIEGHLTNNSTMLEKAMKAYNVSLTIRRRRKVCRKLQTSDRLVDVAITNNMAMIHQEFMEFDKARACFARMSRGLRSLGNSGYLEQREYQGLVLNLMMGRQNQNTLAAAA
jgi:tetratricopeptide (TPR) repeat protein